MADDIFFEQSAIWIQRHWRQVRPNRPDETVKVEESNQSNGYQETSEAIGNGEASAMENEGTGYAAKEKDKVLPPNTEQLPVVNGKASLNPKPPLKPKPAGKPKPERPSERYIVTGS